MYKHIDDKSGTMKNEERDLRMEAFYNSNQLYFEQLDKHDEQYFGNYINELKPPIEGMSLDVGCGSRGVTIELAKQGYKGYGIDISKIGIDKAEEKAKLLKINHLAKFKVSYSRKIPFPDATFETVGACAVFEHLSSPEAVLKEMIRVLKPGGKIVIICPNYLSPFNNIEEPLNASKKRISIGLTSHIIKSFLDSQFYRKLFIIISKIFSENNSLYFLDRKLSLDIKGGDRDAVFYSNPLDLIRIMSHHNINTKEMSTFGNRPRHLFKILSMLPIVKYLGTGCRIIGYKKK